MIMSSWGIWRQQLMYIGLVQIISHRQDSKVCHRRPVILHMGLILQSSVGHNPIPHIIQLLHKALRTKHLHLGSWLSSIF